MSKGMKLIMEQWRNAVNEQFAVRAMAAGSEAKYKYISDNVGDVLYWTARILDPTGVLSWEDLNKSFEKYTKEIDLNDPIQKQTFENAFWIFFDLIDSIPVVAFVAKPVTVLIKGAKLLKSTSRSLRKIGFSKAATKADEVQANLLKAARSKIKKPYGTDVYAKGIYKKFMGGQFIEKASNNIVNKLPFLLKLPRGKTVVQLSSFSLISYVVWEIVSVWISDSPDEEKHDNIDKIKKDYIEESLSDPLLLEAISYSWDMEQPPRKNKESKDEYTKRLLKDAEEVFREMSDNLSKNAQNQSKDIKQKIRFEKDPETGAMISKTGDSDAAKSMAKRTLELRAKETYDKLLDIPIFGL